MLAVRPCLPGGIVALAVVLAGCRGCQAPRPRHDDARASAGTGEGWYPRSLDVERYAGAAACADCHREIWERWRRSPHGRAMAVPSRESVQGDFAGRGIEVEGRRVTPLEDARGYAMRVEDLAGGGPPREHRVELVIASGRQHQLYLTRGADGGLRLLPIYWASRTREWVDTRLHRGSSMDPADPRHWERSDVVSEGNCFHCHLSQGRARANGQRMEQAWVDLSINCEACHGPGRDHVEGRRAGRVTPRLPDLRALDNVEEARLCGRCHAAQRGGHDDRSRDLYYLTLATPLFRADGTQLGAGYQYAGHVTSGCFVRGSMTCSACHDPHRQSARSLRNEDAEGPHSDRQCSVCHRDLIPDEAARTHSRHKGGVRCIDCHMPRHSLFDDPAARQEVSDHGISIPRPRETLELGLPNACDRCHAQGAAWALAALERFGQRKATTVRPWVAAIARGRKHAPEAPGLLVAAIADRATPPFAIAGALDLLGYLPPDPRVPPVVAPLAGSREPELRALALRALWVHDVPRRDAWLAGATSDESPIVRLAAIDVPPGSTLPAEVTGALARDLEALWTVPPALALRELALLEARAGRIDPAIARVERALAVGTPRQLEMGGLGALHQRLLQARPASPSAR